MDRPAELAQAALLGRVQHRARREKEQTLEEGVIEAMIEGRGERDRREQALAVSLEQNGQADARNDDADVLDRRVRQQPLHVRLYGGEKHTKQRGCEAEYDREH